METRKTISANEPIEKTIDETLILETKKTRTYIKHLKDSLDKYDANHPELDNQNDNLQRSIPKTFEMMNQYFVPIWDIIKTLSREEYAVFKDYYFKELSPFLLFPEINQYIYNKPLGYPGDFKMMNYIYDYGDKFLGNSSYEKMINYYTCQVPICESNRRRKEYIKQNILKELRERSGQKEIKMASVASGSIREIFELLNTGQINPRVKLTCYDFEGKVLDYVEQELQKVPAQNKGNIHIKYILKDVKDLIFRRKVDELIKDQDFIYSIGLFDYLPDRVATKLVTVLHGFLKEGGKLMICNASEKHASHRAYYETLGDWNMLYRDEEQIMGLAGNLNGSKLYFEYPDDSKRYLYFFIEK